jgi:hypothetical protein
MQADVSQAKDVDPLLGMPGWLDVSIRYLWFYFHGDKRAWLGQAQIDPCHPRRIIRRRTFASSPQDQLSWKATAELRRHISSI